MSKELTITKEKVREAAAKCSTADATLRALFPEAFGEVFEFGNVWRISLHNDGPMFIGDGYAPKGLEHKCLVVSTGWEMRTQQHEVFGKTVTVLTFHKKP